MVSMVRRCVGVVVLPTYVGHTGRERSRAVAVNRHRVPSQTLSKENTVLPRSCGRRDLHGRVASTM